MSTGKRLAKRSIIGTRVCAPGNDGKYYSGVIHAVKTPASATAESGLRITPKTRYSVRFDSLINSGIGNGGGRPPSPSTEYSDRDLIGPGFGSVTSARLVAGQKVYLTYNGREIHAEVTQHREHLDEVDVIIAPTGQEGTMRLTKRIDEVRLLESRKSARLADQDTDFARLADMAGDRKRASSHSIDVPHVPGSRKRRPSSSNDSERSYNGGWPLENYARIGHRCGREGCRTNERGDCMDECTAALVLMSLSCSPHSPHHSLPLHCPNGPWMGQGIDNAVMGSPGNGGTSNSSSSDVSWRSGTPSPQLSEEGASMAASTWPTSNNPSVGVRPIINNNNIDNCNASTSHNQLNLSYNASGSSSGSTPNSSGTFDEGIVTDYLEEMHPRKKKRELQNQSRVNRHLIENGGGYKFEETIPVVTTMVFKCTWPGCTEIKTTCPLIEEHVRQSHLGPKKIKTEVDDEDCDMSDHEEEFYYQEVAVNHMSSPPTMSHRDMARPPHEDPEYQKQLRLESTLATTPTTPTATSTSPGGNEICALAPTVASSACSILPAKERLFSFKVASIRPRSPATPMKHMKHSSRHNHQTISMLAVTTAIGKIASPRRVRGDTKKCRKIYGMENREQWCTQCKWKKACVRFAE